VLTGGGLGAFAVRGHALAGLPGGWSSAFRPPGPRRLELWLASRPELRWAHLGGPLGEGEPPPWSPVRQEDAEGLEGFAWRDADDGRPARLVPARLAGRISLAAWPAGGEPALASLASLLAEAPPEAEIELLAAPQQQQALADRIGSTDGRVSVRPVDTPAAGGAGAWLRALSEGASGEAVLLVRAGARLEPRGRALEELAAWALCSRVGAVSAALRAPDRPPLSGLGLARAGAGWAAGSAHEAGREGQSRPVLAAPGDFISISRARLAQIGGVDDLRFPDLGADLDLGLRLRRAGWPCLLLGDLAAALPGLPSMAGAADLAPLDPAELAAAAAAFPAGEGP
jgi:hypothetical protein